MARDGALMIADQLPPSLSPEKPSQISPSLSPESLTENPPARNLHFVRKKGSKGRRTFYAGQFDGFHETNFDKIQIGDQFYYMEDGKRSSFWLACGSAQFSLGFETIPSRPVDNPFEIETTSLRELRGMKTDGNAPVYARIGGKVLPVGSISTESGRVFLDLTEMG